MCVLIVSSSSCNISPRDWQSMVNTAGETAGVAWQEKNRVRFYRGLTPKQAYTLHCALADERRLHLVHLRLTTSGASGAPMSQPFPLSGETLFAPKGYASTVLAHNGTVRKAFDWLPDDVQLQAELEEWSDTAALAWLLRNKKTPLNIDCTTGYGNRFVFLKPKKASLVGNWFDYQTRARTEMTIVTKKEPACLISNLDWDWSSMKQWRLPKCLESTPRSKSNQKSTSSRPSLQSVPKPAGESVVNTLT